MARSERKTALLLALLAFVVYNANLRPIAQGDSLSARYLPFLVLREGTLHLDLMEELIAAKNPKPHWIVVASDGHKASLYPVVTPLVVTPLYLPAVAWLNHRGWTALRLFSIAAIMEKLAASFVASLSVFFLNLALRRRARPPVALLLTLAFAFGTTVWAISSQALWQHALAQLALILTFWAISGAATGWTVALAGLALGVLPGNRPPDLFLVLGFLPFLWEWARGRRLTLFLSAALPVLLCLFYNLTMFGGIGGGYAAYGHTSAEFYSGSMLDGIAGLLVSPARGLFVYSPFFLFLPFGLRKVFRDAGQRRLYIGLAIAVLFQVLLYSRTDWRGGFSFGYRFLTDLVPILIWMLIPIVEEQRKLARGVFCAALLVSVWVQSVGAFRYLGASDKFVFRDGETKNRDTTPAWNWSTCPILIEARQPVAPPVLVYRMVNL